MRVSGINRNGKGQAVLLLTLTKAEEAAIQRVARTVENGYTLIAGVMLVIDSGNPHGGIHSDIAGPVPLPLLPDGAKQISG